MRYYMPVGIKAIVAVLQCYNQIADSYRILPILTDSYRIVPILTDSYRLTPSLPILDGIWMGYEWDMDGITDEEKG